MQETGNYARVKRARKKRAADIAKIKENTPCADCGKTYPACVMDFDHVRGVKKLSIGRCQSKFISTSKIMEEIGKCEIVCANCHRIRTHITRKRAVSDKS